MEDNYLYELPLFDEPIGPIIEEPPLEIKVKWAARDQIVKFYPEYKQLNILMEGNESEIAKMKAFIQSVRDWSNGPNPDLEVVKTIVPQDTSST